MGILIKEQFETNKGPVDELYITVEAFSVNKWTSEISFGVSVWKSKEQGEKPLRTYLEDEIDMEGMISPNVVWKDKDIALASFSLLPMYIEQEVEVDKFEEQTKTEEVPYVSFDENGDEITLYRTKETTENIKVGTEKVIKKVMNYNIINSLQENIDLYLKQELSKIFPEQNLNIL